MDIARGSHHGLVVPISCTTHFSHILFCFWNPKQKSIEFPSNSKCLCIHVSLLCFDFISINVTSSSHNKAWYLFSRCLSRFECQLPHPILCITLATDKKWPLSHFHIPYQNLVISWWKMGLILVNKVIYELIFTKIVNNKKMGPLNDVLQWNFF